eukprot:gb/GECG01016036.1/.p1 GENE.gb/GECG01016036.1/~~gb/GECG01016036.1/.p1  ORF type:complete len:1624 (+),score=179.59 gb/GECG01016036.1/:1-4872(+)
MSMRSPQRRPPPCPNATEVHGKIHQDGIASSPGTDGNSPGGASAYSAPAANGSRTKDSSVLRVERYAVNGHSQGTPLGSRTVSLNGSTYDYQTVSSGRPISSSTAAQDPMEAEYADVLMAKKNEEKHGTELRRQDSTNAQDPYGDSEGELQQYSEDDDASIECNSDDTSETESLSISVHSEEEYHEEQTEEQGMLGRGNLTIDTSVHARETFASRFQRSPSCASLSSPAGHLRTSTQERIVNFLISVPLMHTLKPIQLIRLVKECSIQVFDKSSVIVKEGDSSDSMFIIERGTVDVFQSQEACASPSQRSDPKSPYGYKVASVSRGQFFGERGVLLRCERSATCVARTKVRCIVISRLLFDTVMAETRPVLRLHITRYGNTAESGIERHIREFLHVAYHFSIRKQATERSRYRGDAEGVSPSRYSAESVGIGSDPSVLEDFGSALTSTSNNSIDLADHGSATFDIALLELMSCFSPELDFTEVLGRLLSTSCKVFDSEHVCFYTPVEGREMLIMRSSYDLNGVEVPMKGVVASVIHSGTASIVSDTQSDPTFSPEVDYIQGRHTRSLLCYPVSGSGSKGANIVGVLEVSNKRSGGFTQSDLEILSSIGNQLGSVYFSDRSESNESCPTWMVDTNLQVVVHSIQNLPLTKAGGSRSFLGKTFSRKDTLTVSCGLYHGKTLLCDPVEAKGNSVKKIPHASAVAAFQGDEPSPTSQGRRRSFSTLPENCYGGGESRQRSYTDNRADSDGNSPKRAHSTSEFVSSCKGYTYATATIGKCLRAGQEPSFANYTHVLNGEFESCTELSKRIRELPKAARMIFQVKLNGNDVAWAGCNLFSADKSLVNGKMRLYLWLGSCPHPMVTTLQNRHEAFPVILDVEFRNRSPRNKDIIFADHDTVIGHSNTSTPLDYSTTELDAAVDEIIRRDPLAEISPEEQQLLWGYRFVLINHPRALPKVLKSVNWGNRTNVLEMYRLLRVWAQPGPLTALQLLDAQFPDPNVRAYAVACLENLPDEDLALYLLQLTQVLKYEPFDDSALSRFLLRRALLRPRLLGHELYWYLHAELHNIDIARRFSMILDLYMRYCGSHRLVLGHQSYVIEKLYRISEQVIEAKGTRRSMNDTAKQGISGTLWPSKFQLPIRPSFAAQEFVVNKCKVMGSKKVPLWLSLIGHDTQPSRPTRGSASSVDSDGGGDVASTELSRSRASHFTVIFKNGDDLRQDQLTLQLIRIMDRLWKSEGLDLCMSAYECVATGLDVGVLEVVENSETFASIIGMPSNSSGLEREDSNHSSVSESSAVGRQRGFTTTDLQETGSVESDSPPSGTEASLNSESSTKPLKRKQSSFFSKLKAGKRVYQNNLVREWLKRQVEEHCAQLAPRTYFRSDSNSFSEWDVDNPLYDGGRTSLQRASSVGAQTKPHEPTRSSPLTNRRTSLLRGYSQGSSLDKPEDLRLPANSEQMTKAWYAAQDRFARSCAGYCVATYVMGIGDRHSDNYMLKRDGTFFHIDFGHFLGNFKSKLGVNRERSPFRFTPAMAQVLDGESGPAFERFVKYAGRAYNIMRRHADLLITLFSLMVSAGLPELQSPSDVDWVRDKLRLDLSEEEAHSHFRSLIISSLRTKFTQFDDTIHMFKHT